MSNNGSPLVSTHPQLQEFLIALAELEKAANMAKKHRFTLSTHNHYAQKARSALANLKRTSTVLVAEFPSTRNEGVAKQIAALLGMINRLSLENSAIGIIKEVQNIGFHANSGLAAALHIAQNDRGAGGGAFLPPEILPPGVYRRILEEVNRAHDAKCHNGCAALLRRLTESLIIEAFEAHAIEARIKANDGEYLELKALIGKAATEPILKLSRNTRGALPNLKFLGDLSVHSRKHFILAGDLERVHNDLRVALEELASHLK